jgi:2'-5' RNA ligase
LPEEDFNPHITIGRLRNPKSCKDLISPFVRKSFGSVHVNKIVLFESKLQSYFPVYTPIFEAPFKP